MKNAMNSLLRWGLSFAVVVCLAQGASAEEIDWSAWKSLPVYHNGRVMPLDTYARLTVEIICARQKPTLGLEGYVPADVMDDPDFAPAISLFDGATSKKFDPAELLLSWLIESDKWDEVPFLAAADGELREDFLDLPATNEAGAHLKYASPSDVENADAFHDRLAALAQQRRSSQGTDERLYFGRGG